MIFYPASSGSSGWIIVSAILTMRHDGIEKKEGKKERKKDFVESKC